MQPYLADVLDHITKFDTIQFVMINNEGEHTIASGFAKDKQILVLAQSPSKEEFGTPACLGNLRYLGKILSMEPIRGKEGKVELVYGNGGDGSQIVHKMKFAGPRLKVDYQATDPKVDSVTRPNIKAMTWAIRCSLEPDHSRQFNDAAGLQAIVDSKNDVFTVSIQDGALTFLFGSAHQKTEMSIAEVTGSIPPIRFSISKFRTVLGLVSAAGGGTLELSDKAAKFSWKTAEAEYTAVLPHKKDV
jgi:hypothetical protein